MRPIEKHLLESRASKNPATTLKQDDIAKRVADLRCEPDCEICGGVGYVRYNVPLDDPRFGKVFPCENLARLRIQYQKDAGKLDPRIGVTAEELRTLSWRSILPPTAAHGYISHLQTLYQRGWGMATLLGSCGTGKTTILKIFTVTAIVDGHRAAYANVSRVLDDIRRAYDTEQAMGELIERTEWWANLDVLCLDEMDKPNLTSWAEERLFVLLDRRYELAVDGKALTVIAANYETTDPFPPYLRSRLEDELFEGYIINLSDRDVRARRSQLSFAGEPQPLAKANRKTGSQKQRQR
jgi:DNA replication protein DnaC